MPVHLRNNDRPKVSTLLERPTLRLRRLPNTRIQHQHRHIRAHRLTNLHHLRKQLALLLMPPTGINNNDLKPLLLKFCNALRGNGDWVRLGVGPEVGDFGFCGGLSCLVEGAGAEGVCADDA